MEKLARNLKNTKKCINASSLTAVSNHFEDSAGKTSKHIRASLKLTKCQVITTELWITWIRIAAAESKEWTWKISLEWQARKFLNLTLNSSVIRLAFHSIKQFSQCFHIIYAQTCVYPKICPDRRKNYGSQTWRLGMWNVSARVTHSLWGCRSFLFEFASQLRAELFLTIMIKHARKWTDVGKVLRPAEFTDSLRKYRKKGFRRCASPQIFHPEWEFLRADLCSRDDSKLCRRMLVNQRDAVRPCAQKVWQGSAEVSLRLPEAPEIPANFDPFREKKFGPFF